MEYPQNGIISLNNFAIKPILERNLACKPIAKDTSKPQQADMAANNEILYPVSSHLLKNQGNADFRQFPPISAKYHFPTEERNEKSHENNNQKRKSNRANR